MNRTLMTAAEREAFLTEARTAILSVAEEDGGTVASPVWFHYEPGGDIVLFLEPASRKLAAMVRAGRATLTVQDEGDIPGTGRPPRFVSVTGPAELCTPSDGDAAIAQAFYDKYLSSEMQRRYAEVGGDTYMTGKVDPQGDTGGMVRIRPERWFTRDYGKAGDRWDEVVGVPGASTLR
ncbi:MAG TPA: pyridoxamine 5'-phosphate oxidase family protein [Acidimicrobiales bacterium]|nr:pyridoxamine 5'-phosphate oxidase family protein [Acidimicrobiales bacterium]